LFYARKALNPLLSISLSSPNAHHLHKRVSKPSPAILLRLQPLNCLHSTQKNVVSHYSAKAPDLLSKLAPLRQMMHCVARPEDDAGGGQCCFDSCICRLYFPACFCSCCVCCQYCWSISLVEYRTPRLLRFSWLSL